MSDITTLAAKLKATAKEEIMCREACDTSDLWQDEASPENVLALVEALGAAQSRIAEFKAREEAAEKRYENRTPTEWAYGQACAAIENHRARADAAEARIAELETRTLTVKLPRSFNREIFGDGMYEVPNGNWMHRKDVKEALDSSCAAAGIKLQIEE